MDERSRLNPDSSRMSPSSPGKRRMVEPNEPGKIRLVPRGLPDSDDEDQQQLVINHPPVVAPARENRFLNLSGVSRKRKTVEPITGEQTVIVLPSPTTQIAHQINSIRLAGTPVYGYTTRLPMLGLEAGKETSIQMSPVLPIGGAIVGNLTTAESLESGSKRPTISDREDVISPTSPGFVPSVATNVEISDDTAMMEKYLQRPQHAKNMKRLMVDDDDDGDEEEEEEVQVEQESMDDNGEGESSWRRRDMIAKYMNVPIRDVSHTSSIKVPTIVKPLSTSPSREPITTLVEDRFSSNPKVSLVQTTTPTSTGFLILPVALPHDSVSPTPTIPVTTSAASTSSTSVSNSPQHQSKVTNFSISELLSKNSGPSKVPKPIPPTLSSIPQSFLTLYYQQWYMQMLSNMKRFHGNATEADVGPVKATQSSSTPPLVTVDREKADISPVNEIHSPVPPTASRYSPHASPSASPMRHSRPEENREGTSEGTTPPQVAGHSHMPRNGGSDRREEGEKSDDRQNALLRVSEAHLAILPDEDGDTPLHLSIIQENIPLTYYLVRLISGVRMNLDIANNLRQTPLHLSIITKQPMLTNLLVQNGASVNYPDRRGNTCIHLAAQRKNVDALKILSQATNPLPDFNCRNFAGLTPVHVATKESSIDVMKFLFQMGANKNCADSCSGRTPLHYAVESQDFQMCNFLLESGCNVNAITFSGNTPLHVAAGRRLKEIVALLMAYGANPAIANGEGDIPSDLPASLLMQRAKMNAR